MDPGGRAVVDGGLEGVVPDGGGGFGVDEVFEVGDAAADDGVAASEGDTSVEVVLAGGWAAGGVDGAEGGDEGGEVGGGPRGVGEVVGGGGFAGEPGVDGPVPWVAADAGRGFVVGDGVGLAVGERDGDGEWEVGGEAGEPLALFLELEGDVLGEWEADAEFVAESVDGVVGAVGVDRFDREVRPLRELRGDQVTNEGDVGGDFVVVHLVGGHGAPLILVRRDVRERGARERSGYEVGRGRDWTSVG